MQQHLLEGYYENTAGDYHAARITLFQGLELEEPAVPYKAIGKMRQNLAEVAVYCGNMEECDVHVKEARRIFSALQENAALGWCDEQLRLGAWRVSGGRERQARRAELGLQQQAPAQIQAAQAGKLAGDRWIA